MQGGLVRRKLFVCPSVKRVHYDKTEETSVQIFIPHERLFSWFSEKKNGWWLAIPFTWNFGSTGIRWSEIADLEPIFTRSALAVTASEKSSINTTRKSTTRFPMSLRWIVYVDPNPKGGFKTQSVQYLNNNLRELQIKTVRDRMSVTINH